MAEIFSYDQAAEVLVKQIRAVDAGRANLDVATAQANLVGKWVKVRALELAAAMFVKAGGNIRDSVLTKQGQKAIA